MKIVVVDANLVPHRDLFESNLGEGFEICWPDGADERGVLRELRDADVFVSSRFTAPMGEVGTGLRLVHAAGAGYDGIDLRALPLGALCANTFHHEDSIAEYVVAALVVLRRGLQRQDADLRRGVWSSAVYNRAIPQPVTLRGAVATFLGFGHIGASTWKLLRTFGVEGIAITRTGSIDARAHNLKGSANVTGLKDALAESDFLIISIPLTKETTGLIGRKELDLLGASGLLVNVARGPVVNEQELFGSLNDRRIGGAALDVWYGYPSADGRGEPSSLPFRSLENVLMTPHSSGVTANTFRGRTLDIAENIQRLHSNRPLRNVVNA